MITPVSSHHHAGDIRQRRHLMQERGRTNTYLGGYKHKKVSPVRWKAHVSNETVVRSFVYVKKTKTVMNVCLTNNETVTFAQSSTRASSHIETLLTHYFFPFFLYDNTKRLRNGNANTPPRSWCFSCTCYLWYIRMGRSRAVSKVHP